MKWEFIIHKTADQVNMDNRKDTIIFLDSKIKNECLKIKEGLESISENVDKSLLDIDDMSNHHFDDMKDTIKELIKLKDTCLELDGLREQIVTPIDDDDLQMNMMYVKKMYGGANE